jgi:hypothetical protein
MGKRQNVKSRFKSKNSWGQIIHLIKRFDTIIAGARLKNALAAITGSAPRRSLRSRHRAHAARFARVTALTSPSPSPDNNCH